MSLAFYDSSGHAVVYTNDGYHLFLFDGTPAAYSRGDSLWNYAGKHLGRFQDGWVRDNAGRIVLFAEGAEGGPDTPTPQAPPEKHPRKLIPLKATRETRPDKPSGCEEWSPLSGVQFFDASAPASHPCPRRRASDSD